MLLRRGLVMLDVSRLVAERREGRREKRRKKGEGEEREGHGGR